MAYATNTVFVIRGLEDREEIVATFRSGQNGIKTPAKAARRFLESVAQQPDHRLHEAFMAGDLSLISGHLKQVSFTTRPMLSVE